MTTLTNAPDVPAGWVSVAAACIVAVLVGLGVVAGLIHTARNASKETDHG